MSSNSLDTRVCPELQETLKNRLLSILWSDAQIESLDQQDPAFLLHHDADGRFILEMDRSVQLVHVTNSFRRHIILTTPSPASINHTPDLAGERLAARKLWRSGEPAARLQAGALLRAQIQRLAAPASLTLKFGSFAELQTLCRALSDLSNHRIHLLIRPTSGTSTITVRTNNRPISRPLYDKLSELLYHLQEAIAPVGDKAEIQHSHDNRSLILFRGPIARNFTPTFPDLNAHEFLSAAGTIESWIEAYPSALDRAHFQALLDVCPLNT